MKKTIFVVLCVNAFLLAGRFYQELDVHAQEESVCHTKNGDVNGDGTLDITDAINILGKLFLGDPAELLPICNAEGGVVTEEQLEILSHMSIVELPVGQDEQGSDLGTAKTIRFTGVNVQIVNGLETTNGGTSRASARTPRAAPSTGTARRA